MHSLIQMSVTWLLMYAKYRTSSTKSNCHYWSVLLTPTRTAQQTSVACANIGFIQLRNFIPTQLLMILCPLEMHVHVLRGQHCHQTWSLALQPIREKSDQQCVFCGDILLQVECQMYFACTFLTILHQPH